MILLLPAVLTRMMPQATDQHQPTRQKMTDKNWKTPTPKLIIRAKTRCSAVTIVANLGAPIQHASSPLVAVPLPGNKKLSKKQNQAKPVGKIGSAALARDILSTNEPGIRSIF